MKIGADKNGTCVATGRDTLLMIASDSEIRFVLPQKPEDTHMHAFLKVAATRKIDVFDILVKNNSIIMYWIDAYNKNVQKMKMDTFIADGNITPNKRRAREATDEETETIVSSTL